MRKLAILLAVSAVLIAQPGTIITVAGNGTMGTAGIGGPAVNASMSVGGICVDHSDNIYISDWLNHRVLKVDGVTGILSVYAGNGTAGYSGDGGPATLASLNTPVGLALDAVGNLFIADALNYRVRRVDARSHIITTVAGTGTAGYGGDGGAAVSGSFNRPTGVALDQSGNLYIADTQNYRVRRIDAVTGALTTVAGNGGSGVSPDGVLAKGASLGFPVEVSVDRQGNLLITDLLAASIRRVSPTTGLLSTMAGDGGFVSFNGDGQPALSAAIAVSASNVVEDAGGNFYFADGFGRVRRVDRQGLITTVAGSGAGAQDVGKPTLPGDPIDLSCPTGLGDNGLATVATLDAPFAVALTSRGNLLIADSIDCRVRSVALPSPLAYTNTTLTQNGLTVTATVTPIGGAGAPSGTVQFLENLGWGPATLLASSPLVGGMASAALSSGDVGSDLVMAIYSGDATFNGSGSALLDLTNYRVPYHPFFFNPYPALVATPVPLTIWLDGNRGRGTGSVQVSEDGNPLGTVPLTNGHGQYTYTSSIAGDHQITLLYTGDSNYHATSSWQTLRLYSPTVVTLTANANPAAQNASVTFTATVTPATAVGRVEFFDGATWIETRPLVNGHASVTTSTLAPGAHSIIAVYEGDPLVTPPATSSPLTQTIVDATPVLTTSGSPSTWGQPVTLTATFPPPGPLGVSLTLFDGATRLESGDLGGNVASFTTRQLAAGSHTITAVIVYYPTYQSPPLTSLPVVQTVNKATPAVIVSTNPPVVSTGPVVFKATVTPFEPGLTIQFLEGQTVLGQAPLLFGSAAFSYSFATGAHTVTAVCPGSSNLNPVTSAPLSVRIQPATAVSLTGSVANNIYGQGITFTASLTPAATGAIRFLDGPTSIGSSAISNGVARLTISSLDAGIHSIQAAYDGDDQNAAGSSGVWVLTVNKATASVVLTASPNPSTVGQAVTLTASVAPAAVGGYVQFLDGVTLVATADLTGGVASLVTTSLTPGGHSITAMYAGSANFGSASSPVVVQTVAKVATSTVVTADSSTVLVGQTSQLTAIVGPGSATGTVDFRDGATTLAATQALTGGSTTIGPTLALGTHTITAIYGGDANDSGSVSPVITVTVVKPTPSVTVSSSLNPSASGQTVTFAAVVTPTSATGNVQFKDGATILATLALSGGTSSLRTASLPPGDHAIVAVYGGDTHWGGATSAVLTQTVTKPPSSIMVSAIRGSVNFGQSVPLAATVTPAMATGSVQFLDGATILSTQSLSDGTAAMSATNLAAGKHSITAVYSGDANTGSSTSIPFTLTVLQAASAVSVSSSANPSAVGDSVTFTATVFPATASGSVQFLDGATPIGTAILSSGTAVLKYAALAAGNHVITTAYNGDVNYTGATSGSLTQTVKGTKTASATSLSTNKSTAPAGQAVVLTAIVTPAAATGTIQFAAEATVLGTVPLSGGTATLTASNLAPGSHSVIASYSGDSGYSTSISAAVAITITATGPASPTGLAATASSSAQIDLVWTASSTSGVAYNIYGSATPGVVPSAGNRIAAGLAATSYSQTGLAPSTTRYFTVTAQNANGESSPSNEVSATTLGSASCQVGFTVSTVSGTEFAADISIKNAGAAPINGWQLTWTWAANQQITHSSNATYQQNGTNIALTNPGANATIPPGATVSGIGIGATFRRSIAYPAAFYLNGVLCQ